MFSLFLSGDRKGRPYGRRQQFRALFPRSRNPKRVILSAAKDLKR